jgi:hypothetical protein
MRDLDYREYVGWILADGLASTNDFTVERIGELTDVLFGGGCAGDDGLFKHTLVWANGEVFENGVVFALMKPRVKFAVFKTQSISPTPHSMIATRVDRVKRIIYEFNGRPAAQVYAEALGVNLDFSYLEATQIDTIQFYQNALTTNTTSTNVDEAGFINMFLNWPLALMINDEPFIRAAATLVDDGGIAVYMPPIQGLRYTITHTNDVVDETRRILEEKRLEVGGSISGIINCNCMLRDTQVKNENRCAEYEKLFAGIPTISCSSYGEIYISVVSQSASMIVFG